MQNAFLMLRAGGDRAALSRRSSGFRINATCVTAGLILGLSPLMAGAASAADAASAAGAAGAPDTPLPVSLSLTTVDFLTTNPNSGLKKNSWGNTAQFMFGADGDLERLIGWRGGSLHVGESLFILRRNGKYDPTKDGDHYWDQDIGSTLGGAPIPNFMPRTYLTNLSLEQNLGSKVTLVIGRMNPLKYFDDTSNCGTLYSWQNPIVLYDNKTLPVAYGTWGGMARYRFSTEDSLQIGAYEDNSAAIQTEGWNWATSSASGAFLAAEYAHQEGFQDTRYPASLRLGFFHDTSRFTDPETGHKQRGSSAFYWRSANTVWRTAETSAAPSRYLSLFTTGGLSLSSAQPYRYYTEVGVNAHGFMGLPSGDFVGLKLAYLRVNSNQLHAERDARIAAGGRDFTSNANQFRLEMNMHYNLISSIAVEPSVEYIWNPNAQFAGSGTTKLVPKDGLVFSLSFFSHFATE